MNNTITMHIQAHVNHFYRGQTITYKPFDKNTKKMIRKMIKKVYGAKAIHSEFQQLKLMSTKGRKVYMKQLRKDAFKKKTRGVNNGL